MKVCIYGLGAIGGLMAARLAQRHDVSAIARGRTLEAVQRNGLRIASGQPETVSAHDIRVSDDPAALGPQDLVIVAVKTTGLPEVARRIAPLLGPRTTVLSAMNGVPWWFFHGLPAAPAAKRLASTDPDGALSDAIDPERILGCVVHLSATTPEAGMVRHVAGNRLIIGEPSGGADTPRARAVCDALADAGFDIEESDRIQNDIWYKLWGNMTANPISAITGATTDKMLDDDYVREFTSRCMLEAADVGARLGIPIAGTPDERHAVTRKLGAFRTSMLQDVEAGKKVELDAMVKAVIEIARQVGVATPNIEALFGLARLHAQVRGLY